LELDVPKLLGAMAGFRALIPGCRDVSSRRLLLGTRGSTFIA
jgi:hypothetical protein